MERLLFFGENGKVTGCVPMSEKGDLAGVRTPLVEIDFSYHDDNVYINKSHDRTKGLMELVKRAYHRWSRYGCYGDVIQVSSRYGKTGLVFSIDFIGRLAYPKPKLAADIVPFIRSADGKWFFVGIVRRDNGGKALIGGFREVHGYKFQNEIETCIKESKEEAGLILKPKDDKVVDDYKHGMGILVDASLGDNGPQNVFSALAYLGEFDTADSEKMSGSALQEKRVNQTTALVVYIGLKKVADEGKLKEWLVPEKEEDAKEVFIFEIKNFNDAPGFIFDHHRAIFNNALAKLSEYVAVTERKKQ